MRGLATRLRAAGAGAALLLVASCGGDSPTGVDPHDSRALFKAVWEDFDAHYAYFELGQIDWAALGTVYRDSVAPPRTRGRRRD